MIGYKYDQKKKWTREGIFAILHIFFIAMFGVSTFFISNMWDFTHVILYVILTILVIIAILRANYYFKLHKKYYLIIEESSLSIYRGYIFSRKQIQFNQVASAVQVNDVIIFVLNNGKEAQIYTDFLSNNDLVELKKLLNVKLTSKTLGL